MKQNTILKFNAEYASEVMSVIPFGYINKTVCGCGLTTIALENEVSTIIAVPSVELIRNKVAQYPNERSDKGIFGVYGGVDVDDVNEYVDSVEVIKIMVTYDSLWKVEHLLSSCHFVIDESNKLLSSSSLKAHSKKDGKSIDVTSKVFELAKKYRDTVSFVSATPTPLEYMPDWISELEQINIEWANTTKATPTLMKRTYPYKALSNEIIAPLLKNGSVTLGTSVIEKVIVFINSVNTIAKIVKECKIDKKDVAIVAGQSVSNDVKIKGYNRLQDPTKLPKFTFVTSSGFEGIDLNDEKAISIVVSNTSKSYQMMDMLTDLKQAISRQRNKKNPHYKNFIYLYNQSLFEKPKEELIAELNHKQLTMNKRIGAWELIKGSDFEEGFMTNREFDVYTNYTEGNYVLNENLFKSDKYFILEIREQYQNGFDIRGAFDDSSVVEAPKTVKTIGYREMVEMVQDGKSIDEYSYKLDYYTIIQETLRIYNKVWLDLSYAKGMVANHNNDFGKLSLTVRKRFNINTRYLLKDVNVILNACYNELGLTRKAKSTDLHEFMTVKNVRNKTGRFIEVVSKVPS